jgi:F-type H+-transporting ATPase subunit b
MLATLTNTLVFAQAETGGHEEEGGSFLVSPSVGLMVWTLFLFGVSLFILWKVAFPRIAEALDKRQKAIEESIDFAERTRHEADELLAEYRERLTAARHQADEIVARARKAGEQAEADLVVKGKERREELLEQARRDIETETRRAIQEIRAEVADLTIMATEKVTRKTLTDEDQRRLVEEAVAELDLAALSGDRQER